MPKTLKEATITTRNAREKLPPGVHWRSVDAEVHLGYRKGKRHGVWLVRWRNGIGYKQVTIGTADDALREGTLSYEAATKVARDTVEQQRAEAKAVAGGPVLTVQLAIQDYVATRDAREINRAGRTVRSDANRRLARYVTGAPARGNQAVIEPTKLASIPLHKLTEADLRAWVAGFPKTLKRVSVDRSIGDLKAALNNAYIANRHRLDPQLPGIIKSGLNLEGDREEADPVARENQIMTDDEVTRLLGAIRQVDAECGWDGDLYRLVLVMATTGARYSQIARMRVADFQVKEQRLMIPVSRKGRRPKSGATARAILPEVADELAKVTVGRDPGAPLLERWRYAKSRDGIASHKAERGPWQSSSNIMRDWRTARERAGLPNAIPYSLRHSSIVRGIRANLPIRLVAAMHDTSVRMIEAHYSRWIVDGLEDMARAALVPLVALASQDQGAKVIKLNHDRA